ncbi:MAG: hypothetical protein A3H72_01930 [Candidatus Doudnabacteria bacterium RIFCSPLOWO2_02_FULL_48_8]|uniref:Glycosyl transferase family 1 domain-containing protein n=1 Tax=Candidatus Doudnabacteria bacterium RIFCSPHIGHO2_01_FULL_46_24 TaxID=1817825 RepID=A0A1F5NU25_9BACT|nr:MAG: hypothetical protein A2720_01380 [Candidatus Doudnabacteria bacterium RIFCSPHIGHO2_01_FULL_46_24]OGE95743.1 MAG: hypothetical protein A3H72_01930 [Candidatus Doudnabacteria bacterium RIFCSPLOWO2_02_FULL_48_8]OGE96054.1 MAG: hypothetical protein A3E98_02280 [Candidatus Doudnabacteria bacterium RIFCSPHIGHO2_12_FULL_48_11]
MKIGLDLRMLGGGSGIDRYISELSHEILRQDRRNQYVLFFKEADKSADYGQYGHQIVITGIPHYSYAEQFHLPQILRAEKLDLVHFPHFNVPILYRKSFVVTIHDLTHTLIPGKKKSRWFKRLAYNLVMFNALRSSKKIITVSQSTKNQVAKFFRIPETKIEVVYEAANPSYKMLDKQAAFEYVSKKFGISKPYILYVGVWRRYKNLPNLALAFDKLKERGLDFQLVLAGEPDLYYPEIKDHVSRITYHESLIMPGRVSDEDLLYLYNAADLFVLPSISEGFGLTVLEAAACGTPIACSDISTLREVMEQGAEYFDPNNADNMADVIRDILSDGKKREELANLALSRIRHFSWKKAAEDTIKIYENVI